MLKYNSENCRKRYQEKKGDGFFTIMAAYPIEDGWGSLTSYWECLEKSANYNDCNKCWFSSWIVYPVQWFDGELFK